MNNEKFDILLIEDSIHDAELTTRLLKKNNIAKNIVHLKDGAIAVDFLLGKGIYEGRNTANMPRLILLDLKMPKISGLEVLEKIKSFETIKLIPVVMLTSSKEIPDVEKAYTLGANSFIVKPVDFDHFRKIVNDLGIYWLITNQSSV